MDSALPVDRTTVLALIAQRPGISDGEIAAVLFGAEAPSSLVKGMCRALSAAGTTRRRLRADGLLGNYAIIAAPDLAAN